MNFWIQNGRLRVIYSLINLVKWILVLTLVYLSLPILFGIFPWTGGLAAKLIAYFLDPIKKIFDLHMGLSAQSFHNYRTGFLFSLPVAHTPVF